PHFHLSLQSGSNTVLKRMNRHYTAADFARSCDIIRSFYDHPAITTDIIVGFPGETEDEFRETCEFAEEVGFYEAHVFKYSRRRGTVADRMTDQIPEPVKGKRSEELIRITDRLSTEFRSYYLGRPVSFLSEELVTSGGNTYETGYTKEYVRCIKASDTLHQNEIITGVSAEAPVRIGADESLLVI
ncbi:MAG: radical SAM protein, partial [Lachnospiraceae bacterium]|nr:radical SAM protein [Lachnospiraceae bacterium]